MTFTGTADLGSSAARATMGELGQLVMTGCNSAAHVAVGVTGCKAHDYDRNFVALRTVAIARGKDKAPLAKQLGAQVYIDSQTQDPAEELTKMGGARVILATVTSGKAMNATVAGLGLNGKMIVVGAADEPIQVPAYLLIGGRRSVTGWPSGTSIDSQDTLNFSAQTGVRSRNEIFPLERAAEAYERMMSGKAQFRVVLTM